MSTKHETTQPGAAPIDPRDAVRTAAEQTVRLPPVPSIDEAGGEGLDAPDLLEDAGTDLLYVRPTSPVGGRPAPVHRNGSASSLPPQPALTVEPVAIDPLPRHVPSETVLDADVPAMARAFVADAERRIAQGDHAGVVDVASTLRQAFHRAIESPADVQNRALPWVNLFDGEARLALHDVDGAVESLRAAVDGGDGALRARASWSLGRALFAAGRRQAAETPLLWGMQGWTQGETSLAPPLGAQVDGTRVLAEFAADTGDFERAHQLVERARGWRATIPRPWPAPAGPPRAAPACRAGSARRSSRCATPSRRCGCGRARRAGGRRRWPGCCSTWRRCRRCSAATRPRWPTPRRRRPGSAPSTGPRRPRSGRARTCCGPRCPPWLGSPTPPRRRSTPRGPDGAAAAARPRAPGGARAVRELGRSEAALALLDELIEPEPSAAEDLFGQAVALRARAVAPADAAMATELASAVLGRRAPLSPLAAARIRYDLAQALVAAGNPAAGRSSAKRGVKALQRTGARGLKLELLMLVAELGAEPSVVASIRAAAEAVAQDLPPPLAEAFAARPGVAALTSR
ncbi:MAG: hypothetical protein R3F59_15640 [Myxococcota bacterium]